MLTVPKPVTRSRGGWLRRVREGHPLRGIPKQSINFTLGNERSSANSNESDFAFGCQIVDM